MGIGNTTPAAALIAAVLGLPADEVTGRGTGIDDDALARKRGLIDRALTRTADRVRRIPVDLLAGLGSADIAAVGRRSWPGPPSGASRCCSTGWCR